MWMNKWEHLNSTCESIYKTIFRLCQKKWRNHFSKSETFPLVNFQFSPISPKLSETLIWSETIHTPPKRLAKVNTVWTYREFICFNLTNLFLRNSKNDPSNLLLYLEHPIRMNSDKSYLSQFGWIKRWLLYWIKRRETRIYLWMVYNKKGHQKNLY